MTTLGQRPLQRVAVVGAGTMGSGIAIAALQAGLDVALLEQDALALDRGASRVREHFHRRAAASRISAEAAAEHLSRLGPTTDWTRLAEADLIIEAVFEDLGVKREVFARLDSVARPEAILASNTSYLDLDAIAGATTRPQSVVGLHFFSPAHVMRLLEIVRGRCTAPGVLVAAVDFAQRLQKVPVISRNAFGFIGNRVFAAYRRQCEFILEEGALPEEVDAALEAFGFAMGPFAVAVADLSGLDIAWRMRRDLAATRDPTVRYVRIPDLLCEAGRLGRKTAAGYYAYEGAGPNERGRPDPVVRELVLAESATKGVERRSLPPDEIQLRALLAMANEAALLLAEGVSESPGDVDKVMLHGYGFPPARGGPVAWAKERGSGTLNADFDWLRDLSGPGFVRGDADLLLRGAAS